MRSFFICSLIGLFGCSSSSSDTPAAADATLDEGTDQRLEDGAIEDMPPSDMPALDATVDARPPDMTPPDAAPTMDQGAVVDMAPDAAPVDMTVDATPPDMTPPAPRPSQQGQNCHAMQPCDVDLSCVRGLCEPTPIVFDQWAIWIDGEVHAGIQWQGTSLELRLGDQSARDAFPRREWGDIDTVFDAPERPEHVDVVLLDGSPFGQIPVVDQQVAAEGEPCQAGVTRTAAVTCGLGTLCTFEPTPECPSFFQCQQPLPGRCVAPEIATVRDANGLVILRLRGITVAPWDNLYISDAEQPDARRQWLIRLADHGHTVYFRAQSPTLRPINLYHNRQLVLEGLEPAPQQIIGEGEACEEFAFETRCGDGLLCVDGLCAMPVAPVIEDAAVVIEDEQFGVWIRGQAAVEGALTLRTIANDRVAAVIRFGLPWRPLETSYVEWDAGRFEAVYSTPQPMQRAIDALEIVDARDVVSPRLPLEPHRVSTADRPHGAQGARCDVLEAILPCADPLECFSASRFGRDGTCERVEVECPDGLAQPLALDTPIRIEPPNENAEPDPNGWTSCNQLVFFNAHPLYFSFTAPEAGDYVFAVGSGGPVNFSLRRRCLDGRDEVGCVFEDRAVDDVYLGRGTFALAAGETVTVVVLPLAWVVVEVDRAR